jgi:DNA-binding PadR family transcriptional regulator
MKTDNNRNQDLDRGLLLPSTKEAFILELLLKDGGSERFGLEMVNVSNGRLKRGTIYVTLQRMQEKGFIDSKAEPRPSPEIGIPRRIYWATGAGERAFGAYLAARSVLSTAVAMG